MRYTDPDDWFQAGSSELFLDEWAPAEPLFDDFEGAHGDSDPTAVHGPAPNANRGAAAKER